jgi:hypothetical protein
MNSPLALQVPATLGTTGSEDVLDGIPLGLLGPRMDSFLAGGEVAGLHSPAANAFGYGLIAEGPSDATSGSVARLVGMGVACLPAMVAVNCPWRLAFDKDRHG